MKNILILCTGNSCRSQMAEGYLKQLLAGKANVYSAGIVAHGLNPRAVAIMKDDGVDIAGHTSDTVDKYKDIPFNFIITVCDNARENCPYFPSKAKRFHQDFPDPAKATGTESEVMDAFRKTRDMVKDYCIQFAKEKFE